MAQGKKPLVDKHKPVKEKPRREKPTRDRRTEGDDARSGGEKRKPRRPAEGNKGDSGPSTPRDAGAADKGLERYRIEVGHEHGVKPANIVGAIANEAEIDAEYIGRIDIQDDHSTVDLPEGMPKEVFKHLKTVWVSGQRLQISRADGAEPRKRPRKGPSKRKGNKGPAKRDS
jgi:ATP-dependent RNA helicase DeaD